MMPKREIMPQVAAMQIDIDIVMHINVMMNIDVTFGFVPHFGGMLNDVILRVPDAAMAESINRSGWRLGLMMFGSPERQRDRRDGDAEHRQQPGCLL